MNNHIYVRKQIKGTFFYRSLLSWSQLLNISRTTKVTQFYLMI